MWITWIIAAVAAVAVSADVSRDRAPRITEHPNDVVVRKHEPVTLRCQVDADPPAQISWFHDGRPVRNSATRMVLPEGQLFFLHVQHSRRDQDTGHYWCLATNVLGEARSRNASVELAGTRPLTTFPLLYQGRGKRGKARQSPAGGTGAAARTWCPQSSWFLINLLYCLIKRG